MRKLATSGNMQPQADGTERSSLMLRSAKVICQSGEYLCLMRDLMTAGTLATGVTLRFFHKLVPEQRIFLEQANGATWPIERIWAQGQEAGYRFACDVDAEAIIAERNEYPDRAIRLRMDRPAMVAVGGELFHARLLDISASGARIACDLDWPVRAFVRVAIEGFPLRYGHVHWRKGNQHGINFQGRMPLDEFAANILAIQPFGPASDAASLRKWAIRAA